MKFSSLITDYDSTGCPQLIQNRVPVLSFCPQFVQKKYSGCSFSQIIFEPHCGQNLASLLTTVLQFGHLLSSTPN